jgi:hypothetical protein
METVDVFFGIEIHRYLLGNVQDGSGYAGLGDGVDWNTGEWAITRGSSYLFVMGLDSVRIPDAPWRD